jgi:uncharacterized repeat protein (TIGR01451 family)
MTKRTNRLRLALAATALALLGLAASAASASAAAQWEIASAANTTVAPGEQLTYYVTIANTGDAPTDGSQIALSVDLPEGVTPVSAGSMFSPDGFPEGPPFDCSSMTPESPEPFTCTSAGGFEPGAPGTSAFLELVTEASPTATGTLTASFEVSGGGASAAAIVDPTRVAATPPDFGIEAFDTRFGADSEGTPFWRAGGHPYDFDTQIRFNSLTDPAWGPVWAAGSARDISVDLPPGLIGDPTVLGQCTAEEAAHPSGTPACPTSSQVGLVRVRFDGRPKLDRIPLFNMIPPTGVPARFLFAAAGTLITLDAKLRSDGDYGLTVGSTKSPEVFNVVGSRVTIWGDPTAPVHDLERYCFASGFGCTTERTAPFLRLPTSCPAAGQGLPVSVHADTWENPGAFASATTPTHLPPGFPAAPEEWGEKQGPRNCDAVPVTAELETQPTAIDAETPSGLNVHVEVPNPGLENPAATASSDIKKVEVALPEGMTVNPSQAEGLGSCSVARYESTELSFFPTPGSGCPDDAKIGTVNVKTPLLEESIPGDVYIATPFENQFGSLLALYVVLREPNRGVMVKLAGKVETNTTTGQITAIFDDLPQLPFDSFDFKFREGARAPLVTPRSCGTYTTRAEFTGWSAPNSSIARSSSFEIARGIGGGPCPSGGVPPFKPGLLAGTRNNNAGSYSPFDLRLFRNDSEQQFTNFSIKLPPGVTGKLAGIPFCPDAAILAAKDPSRTGARELATPSCPAASEVGRTLVGAGVGSVLTYVPGKVYLAGPYNGSALSIVAITAAKVGPFDLGTVVVRLALRVNPETVEVFVDPTGSDPLPHIIDGVPTKLRDIRAYVDRPGFVLNPTGCDPTSTAATVLGSGFGFATTADDQPVTVTTRFQAANCDSLGFKPKLSLRLLGPTHRSAHPKLRATLTMPKGNANISRAQVTLPKTEFLENAHIKTICTRVQFKEGAVPGEKCPKASIYGYAKAITPLLDEPIEGPVFLRSSSNPLPDLVAALHSGRIDVNVVGRIDSVKARIRTTFESVPDAPVTKFTLTMQGGKKGLLVNNTELCEAKPRATVEFDAHNGKIRDFNPVAKVSCGAKAKKGHSARHR